MASKRRRRKTRKSEGILESLRNPKKIKIAYLVAGLALVFGGSLTFGGTKCDTQSLKTPWTGEKVPIVAKIQDHEITWVEFYKQYETSKRKSEASSDAVLHGPEWDASIQYTTLRQMIDMEYFDIKAEEQGIVIPDEKVAEQVQQYRDMLVPENTVDQERSILQRIGDALSGVKEEKAFENALRNTDPNLTPARLRANILQFLTAEEYVRQLTAEKDSEIIGELQQKATEINGEINTKSVESNPESAFSSAAMTYSQHTASKMNGGEIKGVKHDSADLPDAVKTQIFDLPLGETSGPIISQEAGTEENPLKGVWLVTVLNRVDAEGEQWENSKEPIHQQLLEEKRAAIEAGEAEMPEDENIAVTDEELVNAYESADVRVIFLKAEDPMQRVTGAVRDDQAKMKITIYSPTIRAMHHASNEKWDLAGADYAEALMDLKDRFDKGDITQEEFDAQESQLRYLIANIWSTRALISESKWMQDAWMKFQVDQNAFGGQFPEMPSWIREEEQGLFAMAIKNLDRAIDLQSTGLETDIPDPFYRWQRAQIDVARTQLTARLIDDLDSANTYANDDFDLEQRILSVINQAVALDDQSLEKAGNVRPETFADPVFPEDEMGLTLADFDKTFNEMIPLVEVEEGQDSPENSVDLSDDISIDTPTESAAETEPIEISAVETDTDVTTVETENIENGETGEEAEGYERPSWIPDIPIMDPNGPYTQELRDKLDALQVVVQSIVDRLDAEKQAKEAADQQAMEQQIQDMAPPPSEPSTDEEGNNLLETPEATEPTDQ